MTHRKPNFFIIGAPKCGTTSLATWLSAHPEIFIPKFKEPHFFNTDHNFLNTSSPIHYRSLFPEKGSRHRAMGEASVWYLYSRVAVANILGYAEDPRFVVLVRNPVDMACSLHEQQIYSGNEDIFNFRKAWKVQTERRQGRAIPASCREPRHLLYADACRLGKQIERLLARVDPSRVQILLLEDLIQNPRREYLRVLDFLGVPNDGRQEFAAHNSAKARRLMWVTHLTRRIYQTMNRLGIWNKGLGILSRIDRLNTSYRPRPPLSEPVRRELRQYFSQDVALLEKLLDRDLGHW